MTVVEYMGDIWKGLLRGSDWEMGKSGRLDEFWNGVGVKGEGGEMNEEELEAGRVAWGVLLSAGTEGKGAVMSLSEELMKNANVLPLGRKLTVKMVGRRKETQYLESVFTQTNRDVWGGYEEQLEKLVERHFLNEKLSEETREVGKDVWTKMQFAMTRQRQHYQRPLPLLTPFAVLVLSQALGRIERAVTEVS